MMHTHPEDTTHTPPVTWTVTASEAYTLVKFTITAAHGMLDPADLPRIDIPKEAPMHKGIIFSGRGPVWLYGHLVHLAHPFKWVAIYDPRLQAAVVIERHSVDAPGVGSLIPLPQEQS